MNRIDVIRTVLRGLSAGVQEANLGRQFDAGVEAGLVDPDFEVVPARELAVPDTSYRGRDGFIEFNHMWTEDFEDWSVELEEASEARDDRVAVVVRQRATGKGSGIPTELRHSAVYDFDGDRIKRIRLYVDPDEAFVVAGLRS